MRFRRALVATLILQGFMHAAGARAEERRALVVSIDGLCGRYTVRADEFGLKIPHLRQLMARGATFKALRGVYPSSTYPSHTTLITGCRPERHGVYANTLFQPPTDAGPQSWYWPWRHIQTPTLVDAAREAGWTTGAVSWPVTAGAPIDWLFPEVWDPGKYEERMIAAARESRPADLIPRVLTRYDLGPGVGRDQELTHIARYIIETHQPRLMLVHLVELDGIQHRHGPDTPQAFASVEASDALVGQLLESLQDAGLLDKTLVAIVSDHGFLPTHKVLNVAAVLRKAGLITPAESGKRAEDYRVAAWSSSGACALVLKDAADAAALEEARVVLAPYVGAKNAPILRIVERDELDRMGANPRAAVILEAGEGFKLSAGSGDEIIADASTGPYPAGGTHGQLPDREGMEAAFILAGPGVAGGVVLDEARMIDVAPTLAALLGLHMPEAEGVVLRQVVARKEVEIRK